MSNRIGVIKPGLFVDTNALHYISTYLDIAKARHLVPYSPQSSWSQVDVQLKAQGLIENQRENLRRGFVAFALLQQKAQEDDQIFVSRISLAEIVHGLVEGWAHIRMAEAGMPYRMRQRASELSGLVRSWMSATDYEQVRQSTEALLPELERLLGTGIPRAGENRTTREVLALLEVILGHVYLDVIDGWLYAEALIEQTSAFLTFDSYFRDTINLIYDQRGESDDERRVLWVHVRESLQRAVAPGLLVSPEEQSQITIPEALTWKQIKDLVPLEVRE
jgi:hypothetical protein